MTAEVFRIRPKDFSPVVEAAACYIRYGDKYLFIQRAPGQLQENLWGIPGGKVEAGEDPQQSVLREIREEVGVVLDEDLVEDLGSVYVRCPKWDYVFHIFAHPCSKLPQVILSNEHQDHRWATLDEASQLPQMIGSREVAHHYKALSNNVIIGRKPFYFLRHGEVEWNEQALRNNSDVTLTAQGRSQAFQRRQAVHALPLSTVCFSPLNRAKETKEIVVEGLSVHHLEVDDLRECDSPTWDKMVKLEEGNGYEVCNEVARFIAQAVSGVGVAVEQEGSVLVVAHGGVHWALCYHMMVHDHPWKIDFCQLVHFEPIGTNQWKATQINH